jgi:hypothetical protein
MAARACGKMGAFAGFARSCVRNTSPSGRHQDQTADVRQFLRGRECNQAAFAMAEQPDAGHAGFPADDGDPGGDIGDVVVDGHRVGIGHRRAAAEHAALVDTHRADAALGQPLGQQFIGRCPDAQRIVAVAIGWT